METTVFKVFSFETTQMRGSPVHYYFSITRFGSYSFTHVTLELWPCMHSWKWSENNQFPPLHYVKDADLWKLPAYAGLREKLGTPVPTPEVSTDRGGYITVAANQIQDPSEGGVPLHRCNPLVADLVIRIDWNY